MRWKALVLGAVTGGLLGFACSSPLVRDLSGGGGPPPGDPACPASSTGGPDFALPPPPSAAPAAPGSGPCVNLECQQTTCLFGACKQQRCPAGQKTTLRGKVFDPAGRGAALQRRGLRAQRAARPHHHRPQLRSLRLRRSRASRSPRRSPTPRASSCWTTSRSATDIPLVDPGGQVAPRRSRVARTQACAETVVDDPQPDAPAAQPETRATSPRSRSPPAAPTAWSACCARSASTTASSRPSRARAGSTSSPARGNGSARPAATTRPTPPPSTRGAAFTPAVTFWDDPAAFDKYDMVILSCEGNCSTRPTRAPLPGQALVGYANMGGRVFASHWHNVWLQGGPAPWTDGGHLRRLRRRPCPTTSLGRGRHLVPQGQRAGRLAGQRGRLDHPGPAARSRKASAPSAR